MEDRIKIQLRECFDKDKEKYLNKAIESIHDKNLFERAIVNHPLEIEEKYLFSDDIKKTIKFLTDLKEKGYTSISQYWSGYEDNYFRADKYEFETDDEYISRLYDIVTQEINVLLEKEEKARKNQEEIKRLEARIKQLKSKEQ